MILTCGEKGAYIAANDEINFTPSSKITTIASTVGAGDSFIAGMVHKLDQGALFQEAISYGVAVGSAMVMTQGTALCNIKDIRVNVTI